MTSWLPDGYQRTSHHSAGSAAIGRSYCLSSSCNARAQVALSRRATGHSLCGAHLEFAAIGPAVMSDWDPTPWASFMHRLFQAFIDGLADSVTAEDLHHVLGRASAALNLSCFAYLSLPAGRRQEPANGVIGGHSSAGRALQWHCRGHRFDPGWLHQLNQGPS